MARIEIFFGEMGSGKSYHAKLQAEWSGIPFLEGDDVIVFHHDMLQRVLAFKPLTREMVSGLVRSLIDEIKKRAAKEVGLCVSQALYFDSDRKLIDTELRAAGHDVVWYWVRPGTIRNIRQVLSREKGWRWAIYWLKNTMFFERPTHPHVEI